jgi:hypothetical protein
MRASEAMIVKKRCESAKETSREIMPDVAY